MAPPGILPPLFGFPWEREEAPVPANEPETPPEQKASQPAPTADTYGLVMRRKGRDPVWLNEYKRRLAEASRVAAEQTRHLKGPRRVEAMNQIVRDLMKADHGAAT